MCLHCSFSVEVSQTLVCTILSLAIMLLIFLCCSSMWTNVNDIHVHYSVFSKF